MISCKNKKILHIMNVNVFRVVAEDYFDRPSVCIYVRLHVCPFAFMSVCTYVRLHLCPYACMFVAFISQKLVYKCTY